MTGSTRTTRSEDPTRSSDENFRLLVGGVREYAIFMLDPEGRILTWNSGAERLKGYAESEVIGSSFTHFFTPEDVTARVPERMLASALEHGEHREEGWRVRKDGTRFWADVVVTALYGRDGALRGFAKITRDETEKHRMQEQLRASEESFRLLVGGLREHALYMLDPGGKVVSWNEGAQRIKQYRAEEIIGRHFSVFFPTEDRAGNKPQRELEIAARLGTYEEEGWRVRKDGTRFWAAAVVTALRDANGVIKGFAKVTRDESLRHQAGVQLQQALDRAIEAETKLRQHASSLESRVAERTALLEEQKSALAAMNAELEQFAYVASHDLQEPLRMVTMHLDLVQRRSLDKLDDRSRNSVAQAIAGAERMRTLINSLLAYSRLDHAPKPCEPADANRAYSEAMENLRPMADQAGARVESDPLPALPIGHEQLVQVFQNLISNGIKHNRSGQPTVAISARRDGADWIVSVRDNGIGIEPAHTQQIFQPFKRLYPEEFSGSGVGLAIVKKIVERHGGRVTVESQPGVGTTISFSSRAS